MFDFIDSMKLCAIAHFWEDEYLETVKDLFYDIENYFVGFNGSWLNIKRNGRALYNSSFNSKPVKVILPELLTSGGKNLTKMLKVDLPILEYQMKGFLPISETTQFTEKDIYINFLKKVEKISLEIFKPEKYYAVGADNLSYNIMIERRWDNLPILGDYLQDRCVKDQVLLDWCYNGQDKFVGSWGFIATNKTLFDRCLYGIPISS